MKAHIQSQRRAINLFCKYTALILSNHLDSNIFLKLCKRPIPFLMNVKIFKLLQEDSQLYNAIHLKRGAFKILSISNLRKHGQTRCRDVHIMNSFPWSSRWTSLWKLVRKQKEQRAVTITHTFPKLLLYKTDIHIKSLNFLFWNIVYLWYI